MQEKMQTTAFPSHSILRIFVFILTLSTALIQTNHSAKADSALTPRIFIPYLSTLDANCKFNEEEAQLANLMRSAPEQQRKSLGCNPILSKVAQERAEDMARRGYFDHTNPDGLGPNAMVLAAGYVLPKYYPQDGNNIESIAGGTQTVEETWNALINSPSHRTHLLAENKFYQRQTDFGVGYVYNRNSTYQHYWVIITVEPGK